MRVFKRQIPTAELFPKPPAAAPHDDSLLLTSRSGFRLTVKQQEAMRLLSGKAVHLMLFGGSRSGKTFLLCRAVAVRAMKAPGSRHAILRFRFNHVKASIILDTWPKMMRLCYPGVLYRIDKSDWYCEFNNGAQVWFGGLDDKERTEKILGQEYVTIYLNECSQISYAAREMVVTRLAQQAATEIKDKSPVPMQPRMYYDCNPPSKAHWTFKIFIQKIDPETRKVHKRPAEYQSMKINPSDNLQNLSKGYLDTLQGLSSRLRKRFLDGDFIDVTDNALFQDEIIERWRVLDAGEVPDMVRIVVAVDPSGAGDKDNADNDEIGIMVCGLGTDGNGYIMEDLTVKAGPATWGKIATDAFDRHEANAVVGEINFGGAMVEHVIKTAREFTPFICLTATRGKHIRAEPFSALYEQGRIRHIGYHRKLEDELTLMTVNGYIGEGSPNRADSAIWGLTELFGKIVAPKSGKKYSGSRINRGGASIWAN